MPRIAATMDDFANLPGHNSGPSLYQNGAINTAIIKKIKDIYFDDTIKTLAKWLGLTIKTAKNRIQGAREFSLDEVGVLLSSDHGFKVLTAIMAAAAQRPGYRPPAWWTVCEPLMDLADAELLCEAVRRRTDKVIRKREDVADALEAEIRRAQTLAIHGSGPARAHADALQSISRNHGRVLAPVSKGRRR
jgi:hypothetical protein